MGNFMIKNGNGSIEERMIFIDFDQAAFGYRAFDLLYFLAKWTEVFLVKNHIFCRKIEFSVKCLKSFVILKR